MTQKTHSALRRTHGFSASQGFSSLSSFPSTFSAFLFDGLATVKNTFQQQNNGNSAASKRNCSLQLYNLLDYWLLQMKWKKLKIMNWTKMICWLSSHGNEGFGWLRLFSPGPGPPAPCLEDVAGVACDTGAGAASSTSPWDFATNQPLVQRAGNEKLCNSRVH